MNFKIIFLISATLSFSCNNLPEKSRHVHTGDTLINSYSSGFEIIKTEDIHIVKVYNPWQQAEDITFSYVLGSIKPKNLNENEIFIKTPVTKVICMSTTHIAYLDALGQLQSIKGVSGSAFINNLFVNEEIEKGNIPDVGYEQNLNFELILSLKPDLVFAYSVGAEVSGVVTKLKALGIPVVIVGEYLENEPLAKAEWLKFFSVFFNAYEKAGSIFDSIQSQYNTVKLLAQRAKGRPIVMSGLPWNGSWYVSGGQTYTGKLIEHANADYIWKNEQSRESIPVDYELVFQKSSQAEIWVNLGSTNSIEEVYQTDKRLAGFKAYKNKQLFNNNARSSKGGGNDYWESGILNPQIILKDLIYIFHPELLPNHQLVYYQKLE